MKVRVEFFRYYPEGCEDDPTRQMEAKVLLVPNRLARFLGCKSKAANIIRKRGDHNYYYYPSNRKLSRFQDYQNGHTTGSRVDSTVIEILDDMIEEAAKGVNPLEEDWVNAA